MRRILRLTTAAVALVVVLTGASLGVALLVLDDEDYLEFAELALEEALGWTLEVRGPVSVDRALTFALTGHDAVLTRVQTRLAATKQAIFRLELPALLRGQFQFEVEVQEPEVQFTVDKAGKTSWNFEQFAGEGGGFPLAVVIAGIRLGEGKALVNDESSGTSLEFDLDEFVFQEAAGNLDLRRNSFQVTALKASLGRSDLTGDLSVQTNDARPRLTAELSSRRIDLDAFFVTGNRGTAEQGKTTPSEQPQRVFSEAALALDWLNAFNARIRADVKRLILYSEFSDLSYTLDVDNGLLALSHGGKLGHGSFDTRLRIDSRRSPASFHFVDKVNRVPLTAVLELPEGIILGGEINGYARIEGRGNTPRALAAGPLVHLLRDWVNVNEFSCANTLKRVKKHQETRQSSRKGAQPSASR